jgi:hypothetical protein
MCVLHGWQAGEKLRSLTAAIISRTTPSSFTVTEWSPESLEVVHEEAES